MQVLCIESYRERRQVAQAGCFAQPVTAICAQDQAGLGLLGRKKKRDLVLKALPPRLLIMLAIRHFGKLNGDRLSARLPKIICDGPGIVC
jgi:hypothetical protein